MFRRRNQQEAPLTDVALQVPRKRGQYGRSGRVGYGQKGMLQSQKFLPPGYDANATPFYLRMPIEDYYKDVR